MKDIMSHYIIPYYLRIRSVLDTTAGRDSIAFLAICLFICLSGSLIAVTDTMFGAPLPGELCSTHATVFTTFAADRPC